jgi:hypothetical protein
VLIFLPLLSQLFPTVIEVESFEDGNLFPNPGNSLIQQMLYRLDEPAQL